MLRTSHLPQLPGLRESGEALARSLVRLKPVDPEFWMALAEFHEACGNAAAAARERAEGKNLNPRRRAF
jgi:predicted Zn-dependent protease